MDAKTKYIRGAPNIDSRTAPTNPVLTLVPKSKMFIAKPLNVSKEKHGSTKLHLNADKINNKKWELQQSITIK